MDPTCVFNFFTFFERILYKSNYIIFIFSWCATHTKIRSKLVFIVTAGSQKITPWGPQRTPLGILRVNVCLSGNVGSWTCLYATCHLQWTCLVPCQHLSCRCWNPCTVSAWNPCTVSACCHGITHTPYAFTNWQWIFTGATHIAHKNQNTLHTSKCSMVPADHPSLICHTYGIHS